jgi:transglutaminase-like putative cysteine protease
MWRNRVLHATGYAYPSPATASYNEARLTPRSDSRQNVVLNRIETLPATRSYRYIDYWGTAVTAFDLHAPHTELTVTSASVVETELPDPLVEELSWSDLQQEAVIDRYDELLRPTDHTPASKRIAAVGKRIAKEHTSQPMPYSRRPNGCAAKSLTSRAAPACTRQVWTPYARAKASARTSSTCR